SPGRPLFEGKEQGESVSRTAFVGNLSFSATEEELKQLFSEAGPVVKARIGTDRETGKSRGFAFVEFATDEACAAAIEKLNGHDMGGRRLRVNDADDKPAPRAAGGPPGGGFRPGGFAPRSGPPGPGAGFAPRPWAPPMEPPPPEFERRDDFGGGGGGGTGDPRRKSNVKGSRRGLRGRKRSLWS
ncbi:MAG: RNA recognition motif domain-containing protein, partial [Alphaproteobacteria bacterium]